METETENGHLPKANERALLPPDVAAKLVVMFAERQPKLFGEYLSEILTGVKVTRGSR